MGIDKVVRGALYTVIVVSYFEVVNCVCSTDTEAGARQDDRSGGEAHHYHCQIPLEALATECSNLCGTVA